LSFAIDYDREGGNPEAPQTRVGRLRSQAKPYGREATEQTRKTADELADECLAALKKLTCYDSATCIVAMPPSNLDKPFDLPKYLAAHISEKLEKPDKSDKVRTIRTRPGSKEVSCEEKLPNIEGTVTVDGEAFKGEIVLLIDDLYQSGVSMNYVAMLLLEAGAKKIFGFSCEKTCSNDDNVSRR
jgi:predicted amidophosphoribosyltransferase